MSTNLKNQLLDEQEANENTASEKNLENERNNCAQIMTSNSRNLMAGILGLSLMTIVNPANADNLTDPDLSPNRTALDAVYGGQESPTNRPRIKELEIMNNAMTALFRQYNHFGLWAELISKGKKDIAETTINKIMDINTRHNFWYQKDTNGVISVRKRRYGSPILIKIHHGLIIEICGIKIDYRKIKKPNADNKEIENYIKQISPKILTDISITTGHPPIIAKWEQDFYSLYNMELPHRVLKLLKLKGTLTPEEARVKNELQHLMVNHPKSRKESLKSLEDAERTGDRSKIKTPTVFITKRNAINFGELRIRKTPNGVYEIVTFGGTGASSWQTIAYVSMNGNIMEWKNGKMVKSDNNNKTYADSTAEKLYGNSFNKFKQQCATELTQLRKNITFLCETRPEEKNCQMMYFDKLNECSRTKLHKWLSKKHTKR